MLRVCLPQQRCRIFQGFVVDNGEFLPLRNQSRVPTPRVTANGKDNVLSQENTHNCRNQCRCFLDVKSCKSQALLFNEFQDILTIRVHRYPTSQPEGLNTYSPISHFTTAIILHDWLCDAVRLLPILSI